MGSVPEKSIEQYADEAVTKKVEKVAEALSQPAKRIKMEVSEVADQAGTITFERPGYVTFYVDNSGRLHLMVYDGLDKSGNNDPIGAFDGTNVTNKNWES